MGFMCFLKERWSDHANLKYSQQEQPVPASSIHQLGAQYQALIVSAVFQGPGFILISKRGHMTRKMVDFIVNNGILKSHKRQ